MLNLVLNLIILFDTWKCENIFKRIHFIITRGLTSYSSSNLLRGIVMQQKILLLTRYFSNVIYLWWEREITFCFYEKGGESSFSSREPATSELRHCAHNQNVENRHGRARSLYANQSRVPFPSVHPRRYLRPPLWALTIVDSIFYPVLASRIHTLVQCRV